MLRFAGLLGAAALAVHQLRYVLAGSAPDGSAHGYLGPAGSLVAGALVLTLARMLLGRAVRAPRLRVLWPCTAAGLVAVYCLQETAEGVSPVAHGGWLALPLAFLVGLAVALLARGAAARARRPWGTPSPAARPAFVSFALPLQVRPGTPRLLPARGPPFTSS